MRASLSSPHRTPPAVEIASTIGRGPSKGSAKSFVARYGGKGMIAFADGHVDEVAGKDLLDSSGQIIWDTTTVNNPSAIIWTADPAENPNVKPGQ